MTDQLLNRVTSDPRIMVGKPVTKGARIPVELILKMLAQGISKYSLPLIRFQFLFQLFDGV